MGEEKRPPGRPRKYDPDVIKDRGAPKLSIRFDPDLYERVQARPEGPRAYLESLVRKDGDEEAGASSPLTGEAEKAAEA